MSEEIEDVLMRCQELAYANIQLTADLERERGVNRGTLQANHLLMEMLVKSEAALAAANAIVEKLPNKTKDGAVVFESDGVYLWDERLGCVCTTGVVLKDGEWTTRAGILVSDCYSTPEAAEAARTNGGG